MSYLSYELSKKLLLAGIVLDTEKVWAHDPNDSNEHCLSDNDEYAHESSGLNPIPAPSFLEIWRLLPRSVEKNHILYWLGLTKSDMDQSVIAYDGLHERRLLVWYGKEERLADAACQILFDLLNRNLFTFSIGKPAKPTKPTKQDVQDN